MSEASDIVWPVKTREIHNHHLNSTVWNDFKFRDDDIVIATYGKSGTTWMQQIVGAADLRGRRADRRLADFALARSAGVPPEASEAARIEAQTHRRFVKTHLPVDALVFSPRAKYLYIGRDGRDVLWSMYNHHANANAALVRGDQRHARAGRPADRAAAGATCRTISAAGWTRDGYPFWPFWENVRSWWAIRDLPNVSWCISTI